MSFFPRVLGAGLGLGLTLVSGVAHAALPAGSTVLLDRPSGSATLPYDGANYSILGAHRAVSANGQLAVFESDGDALAVSTGGLRTTRYVYVRDRAAGTTVNACSSTAGVLGNQGCANVSISPNGRYVVFSSASSNLGGPVASSYGLYVKDLQTGATTLMSRANGAAGTVDPGYPAYASVADNGSIAFSTASNLDPLDTANSHADVYVRTLANVTTLVSKSGGVLGNADSSESEISGDGSIVVFTSRASNLSGGDPNSSQDVYTAPSSGGTATLQSRIGSVGTVGNGSSFSPTIDQDGQKIAFETTATNLFATADANNAHDVVLRSVAGATNTPISVVDGTASTLLPFGGRYPRISSTGAYVAFQAPESANPEGVYRLTLRALASNSTTFVGRQPGLAGAIVSASPGGVSTDGNTVVFGTGDLDANGESQIWARTVAAGTNERLSTPTGGEPAPQAESAAAPDTSADGRFTVFISSAAGLTPDVNVNAREHVYLRDARSGTTIQLDRAGGPGGTAAPDSAEEAHISDDGSTVVFIAGGGGLVSGDDADAHVYVWHRATSQLTLEDRNGGAPAFGVGAEDGLDISGDGSHIAFVTKAALDPADTNVTGDVYVRTLATGATVFASRLDGAAGAALTSNSSRPHLDVDGSVVTFATDAKADPAHDANTAYDTYVRDLAANRTTLVSGKDGASGAGDGSSYPDAISADGDRVVFTSSADDLGDGDTTTDGDVHVRQLSTGRTSWVSRTADGSQNDGYSGGGASISADGRFVAFSSDSSKILPGAKANGAALYLRDLEAGATTRLQDPSPVQTMMAYQPSLSAAGQCVAFTSNDPSLVGGGYDSPDFTHVYLRALGAGCVADDPAVPTPAPQAKDSVRPVLSGLKASRKTFATKGKKKGTTLTFTASEVVTVKLEIAPLSTGKKQGKRCLKPSKVKGKAKTCTLEGQAKLVRTAPAAKGQGSLAFAGKIGKKSVKKGRYRLILTAIDAAGNTTAKRLTLDVRVR